MSEGNDNSGEKSHDPTPHKLAEARRKGDIPRSMDMSAAAGFVGLFLAIIAAGPGVINDAGGTLAGLISKSDQLTGVILGPGGSGVAGILMTDILKGIGPIILAPFFAALAALLAQRAFVVSGEKIQPKLSRLNILKNAQNKFGPTGLVQFAKSTVKMAAVSFALIYYLLGRQDEILGAVRGHDWAVVAMLGETLTVLLSITVAIFLAVGLIDLLWQQFDHARKLRMTHQEIRDEHKQTEGDPHIKSQRQQKAQALATNRMLQDVPDADVLIVNPTHYAAALKWSRKKGEAPICVAKGVDEIAARIREIASANGIPIHRDPPTARAIHEHVEIGQEIHPDHYRAVAAAIRFAEQMRAKARQSQWL